MRYYYIYNRMTLKVSIRARPGGRAMPYLTLQAESEAQGFNPRPPWRTGDAAVSRQPLSLMTRFNPRPPWRTGDALQPPLWTPLVSGFNPRPPWRTGDASCCASITLQPNRFQSAPALEDGRCRYQVRQEY